MHFLERPYTSNLSHWEMQETKLETMRVSQTSFKGEKTEAYLTVESFLCPFPSITRLSPVF